MFIEGTESTGGISLAYLWSGFCLVSEIDFIYKIWEE